MMRPYKRTSASNFSIEDSVDERGMLGGNPKQPSFRQAFLSEPLRLSLFEGWHELYTSLVYPLHYLTDTAVKLLKERPYKLDMMSVKALLVERIYKQDGEERFESIGISIKFPSTREMRRPGGLLVYAYADQPESDVRVQTDGLGFLPVPAPGGLYMTNTRRVLSLTRHHVRICGTTRIEQSCSWGSYDRLTGGDDRPPAIEDLDALGDLSP